jgi:hypothetical protein
VPVCPDCQSELVFVGSWTYRGLWGYNEVRTYECATHGPIFLTPESSVAVEPNTAPADTTPDDSDRDSLIPAPRKPAPMLNAGAVEVPEPDSH